uniref:Uncharacterized protein n=1 Tax=Attheya septentrionalis TaxID=420275 RepID=A0A7S2XM45_9STRA
MDIVSVASILASASVTASATKTAFQSTVATLVDQSKQRVQDFLVVDVVDKDPQAPPISKILEQETVSQPKNKSQVKQEQRQHNRRTPCWKQLQQEQQRSRRMLNQTTMMMLLWQKRIRVQKVKGM